MRWTVTLVLALVGCAALVAAMLGRDEPARGARRDVPEVVPAAGAAAPLPAPTPGLPAPGTAEKEPLAFKVVTEPDALPLPGVRVDVVCEDVVVASGRSDGQGALTLLVDRAQTLIVLAWAPGYCAIRRVVRPEDPPTLHLALERGLLVEGRVVLADRGTGAAGAAIRFPALGLECVADREGRFPVPGVHDDCWVEARLPGYVTARERYLADPAAPHVELVLGAGVTCRGRVVDGGGAPMAGADVCFRGHAFDLRGRADASSDQIGEVTTDAEGRFELRGVAPRRHETWQATTMDSKDGVREFPEGHDADFACEIVVQQKPWVVLRVLDPDGVPVPGVTLFASGARYTGSVPEFVIPWVPPGAWSCKAHAPGWPSTNVHLTIGEPRRYDVEVRFEAGGAVRGVVVDEAGRPVARATVSWLQPPDRQAYGYADAEGRFLLRGLPAGDGTLDVHADRAGFLPRKVPAPPDGPALRVVLPRRPRLVGRLDPVPGRRLLSAFVGFGDGEQMGTFARVADDGTFDVPWTPADTEFWVRLDLEGQPPWIFTGLNLPAGAEYDLGVLRPVTPLALEGRVTDEAGRPVEGARLVAEAVLEESLPGGRATTDADGRFRLDGLAELEMRVTVDHGDFAPVIVRARPSGGPLAIMLPRPGLLEIVGEIDAVVEPLGGGDPLPAAKQMRLAPGRYRLRGKEFEIRAGETTRLDFDD